MIPPGVVGDADGEGAAESRGTNGGDRVGGRAAGGDANDVALFDLTGEHFLLAGVHVILGAFGGVAERTRASSEQCDGTFARP